MNEPVKLLHTADWHLGKRLRDFPLLEEQTAVVEQVVELAQALAVDAVIVAGDVFDTANPGVEALRVWGSALDRLVAAGVSVFAIPGNHDQADRLGHLGSLLQRTGVHLRADLAQVCEPLVLRDVALYGLPFARAARVRTHFALDPQTLPDGDDSGTLRHLARHVLDAHQRERPGLTPLLVAHAFVAGAERDALSEDEGEDPIAVGGSGAVPLDVFDGFRYVALGHIHGRRSFAEGRVRYAGSLYPTSFAEAGHAKSVSLVTVLGGEVTVTEHPLTLPRELRVIADLSFDELLARASSEDAAARDHYVLAQVTDVEPIENATARLRAYYPRSLLELSTHSPGESTWGGSGDLRSLDPRDVLREFIKDRTGQHPSDAQLEVIEAALAFEPEDGA